MEVDKKTSRVSPRERWKNGKEYYSLFVVLL